jgi:hypothetical protein
MYMKMALLGLGRTALQPVVIVSTCRTVVNNLYDLCQSQIVQILTTLLSDVLSNLNSISAIVLIGV